MRTIISLLAVAALLSARCRRTENGDVIVKRPRRHVDGVRRRQDTLHMPEVTTRDRHGQRAGHWRRDAETVVR